MLQIRTMDIDDYNHVIELWYQTENLRMRDSDSRENIGRYLQHNPGLSFVAFNHDKLVGAILVGTDGRRGYVQHLSVDKQCRGQGVGRQLIAHAVDALAKVGIDKTHLFVFNGNKSAQAFYDRLGWEPRDDVRMFSFNSSDNENI